ncbi:MAG: cytidine deaminase [Alphaproteobacteria bacterium]|nr:cytidine deaminase [Alphaproteobacteria bacterium]
MEKTIPEKLIKTAQTLLKERYEKEGHHTVVAAALITKSGKIFAGLHVGTTQPSVATCAEIITIGIALTAEKGMEIDMIVAVRDMDGYVISPCGKCREYIADYSQSTARVIVPAQNEQGWTIESITNLLPNKYCKRSNQ